ncbi:UNVERIFIED_CONTAM: thermosome subunit, partial [Euhalothece sp. KZN 001]
KEMDIDHPAANMIVEVSETQEDEVGDGTTTAVILAGELLDQAEALLEQDVHATTIAQGYREAAARAKEVLTEFAEEVSTDDHAALAEVAVTAMTGKGAEASRDELAALVVDAVLAVEDEYGIDTDHVSIEKVVGGAIADSELIEGVIIDKERVNENMPYLVEDANIAVIDGAMEVRETEIDAEVNVTDPEQLEAFLAQEESQLQAMVDHLAELDVEAVFVGEGIDDMAQHYRAQAGIIAVRRAKSEDRRNLARASGATVVGAVSDLEADDVGYAGSVAQKDIGGDERIFVEDAEDAKSVTMVLRGGTEHVVDELARAIEDALGVVRATILDGAVVPGGGAPETALSLSLRDFADSVGGRQQLAVEAFADALDIVPRTLAENAGLDPIDSLVDLRKSHDSGDTATGL